MKDINEIREFFANDLFAMKAGIVVDDAHENYAKCSMPITADHRNAIGGVMGGAIFTLADFTFAVASNNTGVPTVSLNAQITYLRAAKGDVLIAETKCLHSGRSTCAYVVDICDNTGVSVASVSFTGFRKA